MSAFEWVPCHHYHVPHKAVKCGEDVDGSPIYIGQAHYQGDELPAKVMPTKRQAYISHAGKEIPVDRFNVLVEKSLKWVDCCDGHIPHGAVPAGRTSNGETLYVGRTKMHHATVVGKVHPSHRCLYVPYGGKEEASHSYEILVVD